MINVTKIYHYSIERNERNDRQLIVQYSDGMMPSERPTNQKQVRTSPMVHPSRFRFGAAVLLAKTLRSLDVSLHKINIQYQHVT